MIPIEVLKTKKVNQSILKKEFIDYFPIRLDYVMENYEDRNLWDLAGKLDFIDYHYRRYLKGHAKTLHRVIHEFRQLESKYINEGLMVLDEIANLAEINEFYELLNKHKQAKEKINNIFI